MWDTQHSKISQAAEEILKYLRAKPSEKVTMSDNLPNVAYGELKKSFDPKYGGFSKAPKFPSPHMLLFLIEYASLYGEHQALDMAVKTLECMFRGGIYDHIGLGFCRYSTDNRWLAPHFEKMLYDNALLGLT